MYIRFVSARQHPAVDAEAGIFFEVWELMDSSAYWKNVVRGSPSYRSSRRRRKALYQSFDAFDDLGTPKLTGRGRLRDATRALFWFKAEAKWEHSRHKGSVVISARDLVRDLRYWGVEIREVSVECPGRILWQDDVQVLAVPEHPVPRAFPCSRPRRKGRCRAYSANLSA